MILTKNIVFKNFKNKPKVLKLKRELLKILKNKNEVIKSLSKDYKYSYTEKKIQKIKKNFSELRIIGMGGSILGTKAIFSFLKKNLKKKKIYFIDNLKENIEKFHNQKKVLNLIVSKSGNTLETITNHNILFKKKRQKNIFITEKNDNYLRNLARQIKSEVIDHNNFIGGRYSVLSEVGMLPASLMGLKEKKFKQFNNIVRNKNFLNSLIYNAANIISFLEKKKYNSIIINYDEDSDDLFKWYQQLVAESLGKKQKGVLPLISTMPKDNHSLMQLYLDGPRNNFYTFFNVKEKKSEKINNKLLLKSHEFLRNKTLNQILTCQKKSTEKIFFEKNIPFRSFEILNKTEETLGELFSFFILETILIGKFLKVNPFDQPAVELIKIETKKGLSSKGKIV